MEILTKIKGWAGALTEVGVSLLSLGIILEVLFNGQNILSAQHQYYCKYTKYCCWLFSTRTSWSSCNLGTIFNLQQKVRT